MKLFEVNVYLKDDDFMATEVHVVCDTFAEAEQFVLADRPGKRIKSIYLKDKTLLIKGIQ